MIYFNFLYNFRIATESTCKFLMVFCMNLKKKRLKTKFGEVRDTEEFIEQRKIEKQVNTVKQSNRLKLVSSFLRFKASHFIKTIKKRKRKKLKIQT